MLSFDVIRMLDGMVKIYTYRGSRPELARKDSQTCGVTVSVFARIIL
jgi:hypothetical protein